MVPTGCGNPSKADGPWKDPWSVPDWGAEIPYDLQTKNQNINNRSNVVTNSI